MASVSRPWQALFTNKIIGTVCEQIQTSSHERLVEQVNPNKYSQLFPLDTRDVCKQASMIDPLAQLLFVQIDGLLQAISFPNHVRLLQLLGYYTPVPDTIMHIPDRRGAVEEALSKWPFTLTRQEKSCVTLLDVERELEWSFGGDGKPMTKSVLSLVQQTAIIVYQRGIEVTTPCKQDNSSR
jgi:hypothetical protein